MNPFSVVTFCQNNLPSLSLPSVLSSSSVRHKRVSSHQQSPSRLNPHTFHPTSASPQNPQKSPRLRNKMSSKSKRSNPQAILPEHNYQIPSPKNDIHNNLGRYRSRSHGSQVLPMASSSPPSPVPSSSSVFPSPSTIVPRNAIRRNNSTPAVQAITSVVDPPERTKTLVSSRVSMDSFDRAKFFRSAVSGTTEAMSPSPSSVGRTRHKKTSSSPSALTSPPLVPTTSPFVFPGTPTLSSTSKENDVEPLNLGDAAATIEPPVKVPPSMTRSFFGNFSGPTTPSTTPPASPALRAASAKKSDNSSPPPSPSLLTRSKAYIPSIPRPSPLMPFRAAQKVVSSVTSVGTGLLPSKEQLGSIPVAGRILKHPVMDSTLTYIASKTTRRGSQGGDARIIPPEEVHYRKLNRKLVDQSITLSALAIEKEEQSKYVDDEAGDDAFELYLTAIATLMHALPIETCDPLRREAFESQLRSFLDDNHLGPTDKDSNSSDKKLRRSRRRRHRRHRDLATSLIDHYSSTTWLEDGKSVAKKPPNPSDSKRSRRHRRGHQRTPSGTLGNTIINTAVESAIRLKQSPIPDVIRTCFRVSGVVLAKVDERFHLQEKAWQISKQSIEKAIELDKQYAIHEAVTETFFATVTGLVKAGIAYKETPSYATVRGSLPSNQAALPPSPSRNSEKKSAPKYGSMLSMPSVLRRRYSIIEEEEEEEVQDRRKAFEGQDLESDEYDSEDSTESSSSSSCFSSEISCRSSSSSMSDLEGEGAIEMDPYADIRNKVDLFMALKGAASLFLGSGQLANK